MFTPRDYPLVPSAVDPALSSFVLGPRIKSGDGKFQSTVEGWFAAIVALAGSGEVSGASVEKHCAPTVQPNSRKLALTGDILDPAGEVPARFVVKNDQDKAVQIALATPDAINGDDLPMWGQQTVASG